MCSGFLLNNICKKTFADVVHWIVPALKSASRPNCDFIKKRLPYRIFVANFVNYSKIPILSSKWLFQKHQCAFLQIPFLRNISSGGF